MGVPGLWDVLRPAGEVHSLHHLAVQSGFVDNRQGRRAYRIGIDASIWFFHAQGGREGENPELRTLFFRCSRLLAMPFLPIFVFDGPKRPKIKRGKAVGGKEHWMVNSLRTVLDSFGFECRTAPGEAEAELAYLNRIGVIDAVLSDDVDCFLFGASTVMRNSSATLSGNRSHGARNADGKEDGQHVYVYHSNDIESNPAVKLSPGGLILIALLRGGDYDQQGIDGCGVNIAFALARAGYGDTLLAAARSPVPAALSAFLPTWRAALRHELSTNASGLAPRKSPTLARRITEDFPCLDVLRCYTHPITSESEGTGTRGLDSLWKGRADVAKVAHVCERYFEWGMEETIIKRFRSFLWPGAVLRTLLQIALEKDKRDGNGVVTPSKHNEERVETPSKAVARSLGGLGLSADDDDNDSDSEFKLVTAIHGERRHASTGNTVEYRLEIDPRELVARARSGIQGLRKELEDSAAAGGLDDEDDEDEEEGEGKKKRVVKTPPADPDSKLRLWMPAVMVRYAYPRLVRDYVERKAAKEAKKEQKGKGIKGKARRKQEQDEEEEEESTPAKPIKSKKDASKNAAKTKALDESEDTSDIDPPNPKVGMTTARKAATIPVEPSLANATTSDSRSQRKSTTQLLDEHSFWTSSQTTAAQKSKPKTNQGHSDATQPLVPRPFPLDLDDVFTGPSPAVSPIPAPRRKYSFSSTSSRDTHAHHLDKSPRRDTTQSSARKASRSQSPSPYRPRASQMKPLHRAAAAAASKAAAAAAAAVDDVIVISSDSDESPRLPPPKMKAANATTKPLDDGRKALTPSNLNYLDSEVIDLT